MSFNCQINFGPSLGHCLSKPLSLDTPVRSGPRHCGQSETELRFWAKPIDGAAAKQRESAAILRNDRDFKIFLPLTIEIGFDLSVCAYAYDSFWEMVPVTPSQR